MKNIKFVSFIIGLAAFVLTGFLPAPFAHAQSSSDRMLIVTPFERGQNLDFFFSNSVIPLEFFEVADAPPVFISIVTSEQLGKYKGEGYKPVIVDEKAGNIEQYYLLYGKRREYTEQNAILQKNVHKNGLELAYPVTNYTTLVKVAPGLKMRELNIPDLDLSRAKPRQLVKPLDPPASRTTQAVSQKMSTQDEKGSDMATILSIVVILAILVTYGIQVKRARN